MFIQTQGLSIPSKAQSDGNPTGVPSGFWDELLVSKLMPDYYSLLKSGVVYVAVLSGGNPTSFTGGAGGTPLIGLYNPANSGKDLVLLQTRIGVRTTGTAAANLDFVWWGGPSVLPTGTATNPQNAYSLAKTGSAAVAFVNTAMTGSTAITVLYPAVSVGQTIATTPTATAPTDSGADAKGLIVAAPGNLIALGAPATLTVAAIDVAVFWAELAA
jgi:hypothetical protein